MRTLALGTAVAALLVAGYADASPQATSATKTAICHRTVSAKKPYVKITVSKAQLKGHSRHAADIIPAPPGACPLVALSATGGGTALTTTLSGSSEVPGPGDPDGTGTATIRLRAGEGRVCFQLNVSNITLPAAAAHIHTGAAGVAGPVVVPLKAPDAGGAASGCVAVARSLVTAILASSSAYYVNVHTSDYPNGAVRGQL